MDMPSYSSTTFFGMEFIPGDNDSSALAGVMDNPDLDPEMSENVLDLGEVENPDTPLEFNQTEFDVTLNKVIEEQTVADDSFLMDLLRLSQGSIGEMLPTFTPVQHNQQLIMANIAQERKPQLNATNFTVAPAMLQYIDVPISSVNNAQVVSIKANPAPVLSSPVTSTRGRRKSGNVYRVTEEVFGDTIDVKPSEAVLQKQVASSSRGKKRSLPTEFPSPATPSGKRIKKYELDDPENPSVRNARAAKANRDRKKQELADLKEDVAKLKTAYEKESQDKMKALEDNRRLEGENRKLRQQLQSINGIVQVKDDLSKYLSCLVPALAQGGFQVPQINLAPGFMPPPPGTRSITAQYNLDLETMTVSCPLVGPSGQLWTGGHGQ